MPTFNIRFILAVIAILSLTANRVTLDAAKGAASIKNLLIASLLFDGGSKGLLPPLEVPPVVDAGPSPSDYTPPPPSPQDSEPKTAEPKPAADDADAASPRPQSFDFSPAPPKLTPVAGDESPDNDNSEATCAPCSKSCCPSQHEVWQVNTRHLPHCCPNPDVRVFKYENNCWCPHSLEELLAPFDGIVAVFVHGNRMEQSNTLNRGLLYYRCLTGGNGPKVRFVIWSWPSDKIKGQIRDIRLKATSADWEGGYLAWFLNQLDEHQLVSLIGYSYGARTICAAMHLRACGGNATFPLRSSTSTMRVVMNAPAMSNCDLSSVGRYRGLMTQVDRMLMLYNSKDPILKRYRVVEKGSQPKALGYTGLTCAIPGGHKIRQIDVSPVVGRSHYEPKYLYHRPFLHEMRRCLLWEPMP